MPSFAPAAIARLSCLFRFHRTTVVSLLLLSTAGAAAAQTITANGTNGAISIYRGDRVAITASGTGHTRDWVGLYLVGSPSGYPYYRDWYYLNGTKSIPSSAVGSAAFQFPVIDNPGNYEFRLHRGENYAVIGTAGVELARVGSTSRT